MGRITSISNRLKEMMEYFGITQSDIARKTGIEKAAISKYVSGAREPRADKIGAISELYDLNPAWLMGYDVPMRKKLSSSQAIEDFELLDKWHRLNESQKQVIKLTIDNFLGISPNT